jgi:hypothetical protein
VTIFPNLSSEENTSLDANKEAHHFVSLSLLDLLIYLLYLGCKVDYFKMSDYPLYPHLPFNQLNQYFSVFLKVFSVLNPFLSILEYLLPTSLLFFTDFSLCFILVPVLLDRPYLECLEFSELVVEAPACTLNVLFNHIFHSRFVTKDKVFVFLVVSRKFSFKSV